MPDPEPRAHRRDRRRRCRACVLAWSLPVVAFATVVGTVDPLLPRLLPRGAESRAAIAIRDDVTAFQKWGSRAFTFRHLTRHYDRVSYFTERRGADRRAEFVAALEQSLRDYDVVDLWLLAHTNDYISWVESVDEHLRPNLRLVYNTGCRDAEQGESWLRLGADAYVGHPGESESPVFYFHFLRRWVRGIPLADSVEQSNAKTYRALMGVGPMMYRGKPAEQVWRETKAVLFGDPTLEIETPRGDNP